MPFSFYDSTGDSTTTLGTGSLVGSQTPPIGYQSPATAGVTSGVQTIIRIENSFGDVWEVCETVITVSAGIPTYSRGAIIASSNGGSRISFGSGTKSIFYTVDAARLALGIDVVAAETPAGTVNGINNVFTTAFSFRPGSIAVMKNGVALSTPDEFYTTGTATINLMTSPIVGDKILVNYTRL